MTQVELADISVSYQEQGSGPPVVLLHGLAEDHRSWDGVVSHLDGFTTYAVDLRGHGGTTVGDGDGTLAQLGNDLLMFLRQVSGPATVVGYSLGGTIGLWAASRPEPPLVRLLAIASSSVVGRGTAEFFAGRIAQIEANQWHAFGAGLQGDTSQQVVTEVDLGALTAARLAAIGDGAGYVNAARAMIGVRSAPLTPALANVTVDVDVLGGDSDTFCPRKAADMIVDALPSARYHEIAGAGHLISVDQPELYGELIARLLTEALT